MKSFTYKRASDLSIKFELASILFSSFRMHPEWRARLRSAAPSQDTTTEAINVIGRRRYNALVTCFKRESRGDNAVETYLLEYMLRSNGLSPSKSEVRQFESQTRNGRFTLEEFIAFAVKSESVSRNSYALSELMEFFRPFDRDNTGMIPERVFQSLVLNCGERFSQEELDSVMSAFKSAENMGYIDYRSFLTT